MKKLSPLVLALFLAGFAAGMCPVVFTPPNSFVHLTTQSQGLLDYNESNSTEKLVIRQSYEGVASDFGLVMPTPSKPKMTARDDELFRNLNDLTTEEADRDVLLHGGAMANTAEGVQVIEKKQVGDFNATVLKADNATALQEWLDSHGFDYGKRSVENFQYYVNKKEEYYFTALKVNVNKAECLTKEQFERGKNLRFQQRIPEGDSSDGRCWLRGGLKPLEFKFQSYEPVLPIRIMAKPHDQSPMTSGDHENHDHEHDSEGLPPGNYLVYTLSDQPLTVPGAKVEYSQKLSGGELENYGTDGRFLVMQRVKFNAHEVERDLEFREAEPFFVAKSKERVINPSQLDTSNGMMEFESVEPKQVKFKPDSISGKITYALDETGHGISQGLDEASKTAAELVFVGARILLYLTP